MVQRKVPNKLGIQADHVNKTEHKLLGNLKSSTTTTTTTSHHLDGKNRGADLKKMMKKSGSFKRSDFDSLRSPSLRRGVPKPAIQKKESQSPTKGSSSNGSPNYMKSTTSSDARKELTQVSLQNPQTGTDCKIPKLKNSSNPKPVNSASGHNHKPTRTLTRTSSFKKLVRTLTKTPSFKPARTTNKKCSQVVICENLEVQRSTCSSTLKDSKFPDFLTLNPGGTEFEGTSVMKVCPYTYCSLNGHNRPALPPLKQFLKAKRHMLKTQKSVKLGCLSPRRRAKPSGNEEREIVSEQYAIQELGLSDSGRFDIYIDTTETTYFEIDGQAESLSEESSCSETDVEDNSDVNSDVDSTEMDMSGFFGEEDRKLEFSSNGVGLEDELATPESEVSDMEWEEGAYYVPYVDDEVDESMQTESERGYSSETDSHSSSDEPISMSTDIVSGYFKEIPADEIPQEIFDEESASFEALSGDDHSNAQGHGQVSSKCDEFEESTTGEEIYVEETWPDTKSDEIVETAINSAPIEELIQESRAVDEEMGVSEESPILALQLVDVEGLIANQERESFEDNEESAFPGNQHISSDDCTEKDQEVTYIDLTLNDNVIKVYPSTDAVETDGSHEEKMFDGGLAAETEDLEADQDFLEQENGDESQIEAISEEFKANQALDDEGLSSEIQGNSSDKQSQSNTVIEIQNCSEKDQDGAAKLKSLSSSDLDDLEDNNNHEVVEMEGEKKIEPNVEENYPAIKKAAFSRGSKSNQELPDTFKNLIEINRGKRPNEDLEDPRDFNPREPNFLPVKPDPEGEKVDLKHQMMDERKDAEEWMLDYALRQAVTKLAPARKRKVALLVEAFETVAPVPKYENRMRNASAAFTHSRPIQACS